MSDLTESVHRVAAETGFSGMVRIDHGDETQLSEAYGLAHRGFRLPNTVDTQFAIASGGKGFTALAVVSLIWTAYSRWTPRLAQCSVSTSRISPMT